VPGAVPLSVSIPPCPSSGPSPATAASWTCTRASFPPSSLPSSASPAPRPPPFLLRSSSHWPRSDASCSLLCASSFSPPLCAPSSPAPLSVPSPLAPQKGLPLPSDAHSRTFQGAPGSSRNFNEVPGTTKNSSGVSGSSMNSSGVPRRDNAWTFHQQLRALLGCKSLKWATVCNAPLAQEPLRRLRVWCSILCGAST